MSELSVGQLKGLLANDNVITVPSGHTIYAPGSVVQVQTIRTDSRVAFSTITSGNGTTITQLNLAITPRFANSKLIMQWMINGEGQTNQVYTIHRNGSLITTSGETGYNSEAGNVKWSGVMSMDYDNNDSSTMSNFFLQYSCISASTVTQTFAPAVRATGGTNNTFFMNRTVSALGQDDYENTISNGTIWEVAQ
jgi:hypothetical protein